MKTLYITRHAKSSWSDGSLSDFERPLNKRGLRDAPFMGKLLSKQSMVPDIILSSPATRAITTAQLLSEELGYASDDIAIYNELYESGVQNYLDTLSALDDRYNSAMVVGHNPTLTMLAEQLSDLRIDNIPTCGIVIINFDNPEWSDIHKCNGLYQGFEYPKKYFA
jgi:phosphohistidine phosphatase